MADLDLTEAVEAAADALRRQSRDDGWTLNTGHDWDHERAVARSAVEAATPLITAQARAETLREAANAWTQGVWADAPRRPDRAVERIATAQYVGDWLRARASAPTEEAGRG